MIPVDYTKNGFAMRYGWQNHSFIIFLYLAKHSLVCFPVTVDGCYSAFCSSATGGSGSSKSTLPAATKILYQLYSFLTSLT